jgi:hypothetical protein
MSGGKMPVIMRMFIGTNGLVDYGLRDYGLKARRIKDSRITG